MINNNQGSTVELIPFFFKKDNSSALKHFLLTNFQLVKNCLNRFSYLPGDKTYIELLMKLSIATVEDLFEYLGIYKIVFVIKNNITIGFYTLNNVNDANILVRFYENPLACKVSILTIAESVIYDLLTPDSSINNILFQTVHRAVVDRIGNHYKDIESTQTSTGIYHVFAAVDKAVNNRFTYNFKVD